jgi:signal transduction histidine kinase
VKGERAVAFGECRDHDVIQQGQVGKNLGCLENSAYPGLIDLMGFDSQKRFTVEGDASCVGSALWAYTLFLPSFGGDFILSISVLTEGPWGIQFLRPQALLGHTGLDPLVHAVVWSVGLNTLTFLVVSSLSEAGVLERLQGTLFVDVYRSAGEAPSSFVTGMADSEDLFVLAQRILGDMPARRLFDELAQSQGLGSGLPHATDTLIARVEREFAGSIGAASAHAMVTRIAGRQTVGMTELIDIADETQQLIETSRQLEDKSAELELAAEQLRDVNQRLRALDTQKDEFLSQVSHELRTPMTSVRSFSEILMSDAEISDVEREKFVSIIHDETIRLTRLLDEILDMSRLEAGTVDLQLVPMGANDAVVAAIDTMSGITRNAAVTVNFDPPPGDDRINANPDRVRQVLINILSNAVKYNTAENPTIDLRTHAEKDVLYIDVIDNGGGVTREDVSMFFEKFSRGSSADNRDGAGLGLPISRAIMRAMKGDLTVEFAPDNTSFFRLRFVREC